MEPTPYNREQRPVTPPAYRNEHGGIVQPVFPPETDPSRPISPTSPEAYAWPQDTHRLPPPYQPEQGRTTPPNVFLGRHAAPEPRQRKRPRIFTWVIVGINALFLFAAIAALFSGGGAAEQTCAGQTFDEVFTKQDCLDAANAGAAIGSGLLFFGILVVWALLDVILGVVWMVTRRRDA